MTASALLHPSDVDPVEEERWLRPSCSISASATAAATATTTKAGTRHAPSQRRPLGVGAQWQWPTWTMLMQSRISIISISGGGRGMSSGPVMLCFSSSGLEARDMATIENYRSRVVAAPVSLNVDPDHNL